MNVLDAIQQTTWRAGGGYSRRRGTEAFKRSAKDWSAVEKPERVFRRLEQLGLRGEATTLARSMARGECFAGLNPLERIIGQSQLMSSFFLPLGAERVRAVGRIVTQTGVGFGTGFLISPRLLMTNNHVLEDERVAALCHVEFDYMRRFDGDIGATQLFRLLPGEFFLTSATRDGLNLDYTIVAVEPVNQRGEELAGRGSIPLADTPGELTLMELANIIQHPGGDPQQVALRDNKVVESLEHFIRYEADTLPGSSGSPVFNDQWQLAALHHSGVPDEVRPGVYRLRDGGEWDTRRPLRHAEQLRMSARINWLSNEGVRVGSIVADARAQLGDDPARLALFEAAVREQSPPLVERAVGARRDGVGQADINVPTSESVPAPASESVPAPASASAQGAVTLTIPLRITVELGPDLRCSVSGGLATLVSPSPSQPPSRTDGGCTHPQASAELSEERVPETIYAKPEGPGLDEVREPMEVICHVSPDEAWPVLNDFLGRVEKTLTLGISELSAPHVAAKLSQLAEGNSDFRFNLITLQKHACARAGVDEQDLDAEQIVDGLREVLGGRFRQACVNDSGGARTFDGSYQVKAAVRDGEELWLSSGDMRSSNQPPPDIRPLTDGGRGLRLLRRFNREWHVVVKNRRLAQIFEAHLLHELETAEAEPRTATTPAREPSVHAVPLTADFVEEAAATRYFTRKVIPSNDAAPVAVQPLLTPGNYIEHVTRLVRSARRTLFIQNRSLSLPDPPTKNEEAFLELWRAVRSRQEAGVDVRLIFRVHSDEDEARATKDRLVKFGLQPDCIRVQSGCHNKGLVVDSEAVLVGSHEWTNRGVTAERGASLIFRHSEIARYYERIFLFDWDTLAREPRPAVPVATILNDERAEKR